MSHFIHISFTPFIHISFIPFIHTSFIPFHGPFHFHLRFLNLISFCRLSVTNHELQTTFYVSFHFTIVIHFIPLHFISLLIHSTIFHDPFHTTLHPCFKSFHFMFQSSYRYILQPVKLSAANQTFCSQPDILQPDILKATIQ